jgi:predicted enzyme related to lactoylglutathione lyase
MSTADVINYIELPAPDLASTKAFYTAAFDWSWIDYGPTYAGLDMSDGSAAVEIGLNALAAAAEPHKPGSGDAIGPLVLFATVDIEASLGAVERAGGSIRTPIHAYPGGRRFHFMDPSGNVLGVYQSDSPG